MIAAARATLDRHVPEQGFQDWITDLAETVHLPWFHDEDARRNNAGLPDLIIPAWDTLLLWELKTMRGRLSDEQRLWAAALQRCTRIEYGVLRPTEADRAYIESRLRGPF